MPNYTETDDFVGRLYEESPMGPDASAATSTTAARVPDSVSYLCSVLGRQSSSSSRRCAASITSGGAGFCNQARIRNKPPAIVPTASTAMTIQNAVDIEQVSAYP